MKYLQKLDDVAGAEDTVGNGELGRLGGREIRSQNTFFSTSPPQNLASSAWANHNNWWRIWWWICRRWSVCITALHLSYQFLTFAFGYVFMNLRERFAAWGCQSKSKLGNFIERGKLRSWQLERHHREKMMSSLKFVKI